MLKIRLLILLSAIILTSCNVSNFDVPDPSMSKPEVPKIGKKTVMLYWNTPEFRTNGARLDTSDIGGYVIRYRPESETAYTSIKITDNTIDQYTLSLPDIDDIVIEVALFDTDGLYSDFVTAKVH